MLQKALPSIAKEIIEVMAILLRWFVLLFCKSDTCLLKDVYKDHEKIGVLRCKHEYQVDCLKKLLLVKNFCPISKSEALTRRMIFISQHHHIFSSFSSWQLALIV